MKLILLVLDGGGRLLREDIYHLPNDLATSNLTWPTRPSQHDLAGEYGTDVPARLEYRWQITPCACLSCTIPAKHRPLGEVAAVTPLSCTECPDGGACHHRCGLGACFRVMHCGPLGAARYPGDTWPDAILAEHAARPDQGVM